jgi:hypothetical protein
VTAPNLSEPGAAANLPPKPAAGSRIALRGDLISAAPISIDICKLMLVERPLPGAPKSA